MRYRALLLVMPMLAFALVTQPVSAGRLWCSSDPVVTLDERLVSISVAIPVESVPLVTGATSIDIKAPPSVDGALLVNDVGFMGHGTVLAFQNGAGAEADDAFAVEVRVSVPMEESTAAPSEPAPMQVTIMVDNALPVTATGTVDGTVVRLTMQTP